MAFRLARTVALIGPARFEAPTDDVAWRFGELKTAQSRWSCVRGEALVEELYSRRSTRRSELLWPGNRATAVSPLCTSEATATRQTRPYAQRLSNGRSYVNKQEKELAHKSTVAFHTGGHSARCPPRVHYSQGRGVIASLLGLRVGSSIQAKQNLTS
jgi:hypothetical protein